MSGELVVYALTMDLQKLTGGEPFWMLQPWSLHACHHVIHYHYAEKEMNVSLPANGCPRKKKTWGHLIAGCYVQRKKTKQVTEASKRKPKKAIYTSENYYFGLELRREAHILGYNSAVACLVDELFSLVTILSAAPTERTLDSANEKFEVCEFSSSNSTQTVLIVVSNLPENRLF